MFVVHVSLWDLVWVVACVFSLSVYGLAVFFANRKIGRGPRG
jgi:hypothetical protein